MTTISDIHSWAQHRRSSTLLAPSTLERQGLDFIDYLLALRAKDQVAIDTAEEWEREAVRARKSADHWFTRAQAAETRLVNAREALR